MSSSSNKALRVIALRSQSRQYLRPDANIILDDGTSFKVNKNYKIHLAGFSGFFRLLFQKANMSDYMVGLVSSACFREILSWIYYDNMRLNEQNATFLLTEAHYLDIKGVVAESLQYIKQKVCNENIIALQRFCKDFNIVETKDQFFKAIEYNFAEVSETEDFLNLSAQELRQLLASDNLNAKEIEVWHSMQNWITHDFNERVHHVLDLLEVIRFGLLTREVFDRHVSGFLYICKSESRNQQQLEHLIAQLQTIFDSPPGEPFLTIQMPRLRVPRVSQDIVLTCGGWTNNAPLNLVEMYDKNSQAWTIANTADPLGNRGYMGVAAIGSTVFLVGGSNGPGMLRECSSYNLNTGEWKIRASMKQVRCYPTVVSLEGKLYAFGGARDQFHRHKSAEMYCPELNQWTLLPSMHHTRSDTGGVTLNGKIYIVGGLDNQRPLNTVEYYDPVTDFWSSLPNMKFARSGLACVALGGELYALGGNRGHPQRREATCEKFNFKRNKWVQIPHMNEPRSNFMACAIDDTTILVAGGFNGHETIDCAEIYDSNSGRWTRVPSLNQSRSALAGCTVLGKSLDAQVIARHAFPIRNEMAQQNLMHALHSV